MPRTNVSTVTPLGTASTEGVLFTWTDCDASNGNFYYFKGRELLVVRNEGVVSRTITVYAQPDNMGRTENLVQVLAASESCVIGPLQLLGWRTADGKIEFTATSSDVKVAIIEV